MSDKAFNKLNVLDQQIRRGVRPVGGGGDDGTLLTIEFIHGFELFNTRPYHNYETWGDGYRVTGRGVTVQKEDLDDAIAAWVKCVEARREPGNEDKPCWRLK